MQEQLGIAEKRRGSVRTSTPLADEVAIQAVGKCSLCQPSKSRTGYIDFMEFYIRQMYAISVAAFNPVGLNTLPLPRGIKVASDDERLQHIGIRKEFAR